MSNGVSTGVSGGHLGEETLVWHYYGDDAGTPPAPGPPPRRLPRLPGRARAAEGHPRAHRRLAGAGAGRRLRRAGVGELAGGRAGPGHPAGRLAERVAAPGGGPRCGGGWPSAAGAGRGPGRPAGGRVPGRAARRSDRWWWWTARRPPGAAGERLLAAALSDHLAQSERILLEIVNRANPTAAALALAAPAEPGDDVDMLDDKARAAGLLDDNRLYRLTAARQGQLALAAVLEDLERVLLDVARGPEELSPEQLAILRERLDDQQLVFKVRVLEARLRELGSRPLATPGRGRQEIREHHPMTRI